MGLNQLLDELQACIKAGNPTTIAEARAKVLTYGKKPFHDCFNAPLVVGDDVLLMSSIGGNKPERGTILRFGARDVIIQVGKGECRKSPSYLVRIASL